MSTVVLVATAPNRRFSSSTIVLGLLVVAVVSGIAFGRLPPWHAVAVAGWSIPVVAAATVDFRIGRLPDVIVLPGLLATIVLAGAAGFVGAAVAGSLLFGLPMLVVHLARPDGLGFGDVKFATLLGAGIGIVSVPLVVVSFLVAAVVHAVVCLTIHARGQLVPFGPALAAASIIVILVASPVVS
jgi:leader peptidase (prepilin peptidase)/N-methyltransferase